MPRRYTTRKLEVFAIHAHLPGPNAVNYTELITALSAVPREARMARINQKFVAIPRLTIEGGLAKFTAYEGEEGNPLFFNFRDATERIEQLEGGEMLTTKTHGLIDIERREAIIEYNQKGAKASDIATTLELIGENAGLEGLSMEFTPVFDEAFLASIDRFRRVRVASIKVARPNFDWGDQEHYFNDVAADSDARYVELTMTAERQHSLAQDRGLLRYIRRIAAAALPYLKGAKVTGTRQGEEEETTVSLSHHIEHQRIQVRMTDDSLVDDQDIERKLEGFRRSRAGRQE
jgi:hypothetical protein